MDHESNPTSGKNWPLVADEPVEVHQDFRKFTDHFKGNL